MRGEAGLDLATMSGLMLKPWQWRHTARGLIMFALDVSGMGCGSCVSKITKAIQALDSQAKVEVDRAAGKVKVQSVESQEDIRAVIEDLGYPTQLSA
jgi:copper chaperone